jgi:hypothetical protein
MEQSKVINGSRAWYGVIKLLIAALAFMFIYKQVISKENFSNILLEYKDVFLSTENGIYMVLVSALMLVNWSLEALKWKLMMRKLEVIPFSRALSAVFSGLTVSFFTPNRIGEYAGRIFHLHTANRIKGTLVTILENLSQLIITVTIGSISLVLFLNQYTELHSYILWVTGVILLIFSGTLIFLFLEVPVLDEAALKMRWLKKYKSYLAVLSEYKKSELIVILGLALLRYIVFTAQFFILLIIFGVHGSFASEVLLINMVFFVMTLIPTFALAELGVRGAVATYFLSKISSDSLAILNASVSLWLINLVIPAIAGVIFIFQFRFSTVKQ